MEPRRHFIIRQQDRHPVMDIDDRVIGGSRQDHKPFLPLKSVPKPGQIQSVPPRQPKAVLCLFPVSLIESGRRYDTSPLQHRAMEHRFIQRRLTPCVDDAPLAFETGKTPGHRLGGHFLSIRKQDR